MKPGLYRAAPDRGTLIPTWSKLLPHQHRFVHWRASEGGEHTIEAILGGWGSGKTTAAVRRVLQLAFRLHRDARYGPSERPLVLVGAPTARVLRDATWAKLDAQIPPQLVRRRRAFPSAEIELVNGAVILGYSAEAMLEGMDAAVVYVDEIAHPAWSSTPQKWANWSMRVRERRAAQRALIVSGLPEAGWVRDMFDIAAPHRHTLLCGTEDNWLLAPSTVSRYLESCPSGYEEAFIKGRWMAPQGAVYPMFSEARNVVDRAGDPRLPVHLGVDVGNAGAIVVAQTHQIRTTNVIGQPDGKDAALHIVDQLLTEGMSLDQMLYELKTKRDWPNVASISIDPTSRRDEMSAIRKHYPQARVVKRDRGDDYYDVEQGIRIVQRGLRDALGNVRLTLHASLRGQRFGLVESLQRYRRNEATGRVIKDNSRDHVLDALRYVCCSQIPATKLGFGTIQRG